MIRFLMTVDTALWVVVVALLIAWVISLKRRIRAIDHPMLAMSRRQRRQWADEEWAQRRLERSAGIVHGTTTNRRETA